MQKQALNKNYRNLDNMAKVFSLHKKKNTNMFRYVVILKYKVDEKILKKALKETLNEMKPFKVKFANGLFWKYLKLNSKECIIEKNNEIFLKRINLKSNNDYLFKVTYYKNKINVDFFHVLTDGIGAMKFLTLIVKNYLNIKYNIKQYTSKKYYEIHYKDRYLENYNRSFKVSSKSKIALSLPGKIDETINNTYHYVIDIKEIKEVCKKNNVTITEYITAVYIYAMYLSIYNGNIDKEIIIEIPIDLRKYYKVDTLSNFFSCITINPKILEKKLTSFKEVLNEVNLEFKNKKAINKIKGYLRRDVKIGKNILINVIPHFIKCLCIEFFSILMSKTTTSSVSNVGIFDIGNEYKKYINNMFVLVIPGRFHKIKCTICSFDNKLNITLNSNINDKEFQKTFFGLLSKEISNIKIINDNEN